MRALLSLVKVTRVGQMVVASEDEDELDEHAWLVLLLVWWVVLVECPSENNLAILGKLFSEVFICAQVPVLGPVGKAVEVFGSVNF